MVPGQRITTTPLLDDIPVYRHRNFSREHFSGLRANFEPTFTSDAPHKHQFSAEGAPHFEPQPYHLDSKPAADISMFPAGVSRHRLSTDGVPHFEPRSSFPDLHPPATISAIASQDRPASTNGCYPENALKDVPVQSWSHFQDVESVKVCSQNVNGVQARLSKDDFFPMLAREKPDVIFLQEFRCTTHKFLNKPNVRNRLIDLGYCFFINAVSSEFGLGSGYAGVAVLSKIPPLAWGVGVDRSDLDKDGRFVWLDMGKIILAGAYAPNSGNPRTGDLKTLKKHLSFEKALTAKLTSLQSAYPDHETYLLGDLNVARGPSDVFKHAQPDYWSRHPGCTKEERTSFEDFLSATGLHDVQGYSGVKGFTFWCAYNKQHDLGMRLDYGLSSSDLLPHIGGFKVGGTHGSDHAVLTSTVPLSYFSVQGKRHGGSAPILSLPAICSLATIVENSAALTPDSLVLDVASLVLQSLDPPPIQARGRDDIPSALGIRSEWMADLGRPDDSIPFSQWASAITEESVHTISSCAPRLTATRTDRDEPEECIEPDRTPLPALTPIVLPTIDVSFSPGATATALADTGASSSLISTAFAVEAMGGYPAFKSALKTDVALPQFRTADGRFTRPSGVLEMEFFIDNCSFSYSFYVLHKCAHDIILGGDFFDQTDALLDYRKGRVLLTEPNSGIVVSCPFKVHRTNAHSASASVPLFSTVKAIIAPGTAMILTAACDQHLREEYGNTFGFVNAIEDSNLAIPNACTRLSLGSTKVVLTNRSTTDYVHIQEGQLVANLSRSAPTDFDFYAIDLEKLGTDEECFVDLASMVESAPAVNAPTFKAKLQRTSHGDEFYNLPVAKTVMMASVHPPPATESTLPPVSLQRMEPSKVAALSDTEADTLMKQAPLSECLLNPDLEPEQLRSLKKLVIANRDIFNLSPKNPGVIRAPAARINTGDNEPASFPFRPTMPHLRPVVEEHLNNMLASGIIRHSTSPWGAALLIVPKKDGQVRITTDFRLLNDRTEKFCYPLPRVDDSIATLHGNKFFTAVDFTSAFFQCPLREEDRHKTSFRCHYGSFEYNVLPQGVVNGPSYFQRYIDTVLGGLKFQCALSYADDVLIFSPTFDQHLLDVEKVFQQFRSVGFHISAKKSTFAMPSVTYLGHVISSDGVAPDPNKIASIMESNPSSRADIRSWVTTENFPR